MADFIGSRVPLDFEVDCSLPARLRLQALLPQAERRIWRALHALAELVAAVPLRRDGLEPHRFITETEEHLLHYEVDAKQRRLLLLELLNRGTCSGSGAEDESTLSGAVVLRLMLS